MRCTWEVCVSHDAPIAHAIGSFDNNAPCARRGSRRDRILRVVARSYSEPRNPTIDLSIVSEHRQNHYAPWSRSAINIFPAQNSTCILSFYIRLVHGEVPPAPKRRQLTTQIPPKESNDVPGNLIPNWEYIPLGMKVLFKTDAPEVADSHDAHVEG